MWLKQLKTGLTLQTDYQITCIEGPHYYKLLPRSMVILLGYSVHFMTGKADLKLLCPDGVVRTFVSVSLERLTIVE